MAESDLQAFVRQWTNYTSPNTSPKDQNQVAPSSGYDPSQPDIDRGEYRPDTPTNFYNSGSLSPNYCGGDDTLYDPCRSPEYRPTDSPPPSSPPEVHNKRQRSPEPLFTLTTSAARATFTSSFVPGRLWTLSIEKLLEGADNRIKLRHKTSLQDACELCRQVEQGFLFLDCCLLRLVPSALLSANVASAWSQSLCDQISYLSSNLVLSTTALPSRLALPATCPLQKLGTPMFDLDRQGFVGLSGQEAVAALPLFCVRVDVQNNQVVFDLDYQRDRAWSPQEIQSGFLRQMATLCRAMDPCDVPSLSKLACDYVDAGNRLSALQYCQARVALSARQSPHGQHQVLLALKKDEKGMRSALHALAVTVRRQGGLSQYCQQFLQYNSAALSSEKHARFISGQDKELLGEAWPLDLEKMERYEAETVVSFRSTDDTRENRNDRNDRGKFDRKRPGKHEGRKNFYRR